MTTDESKEQGIIPVQLLIISNRLVLKAFNAKSREALIFIILNDTVHMIHYDRALLWNMAGAKPELLGISGQAQINKEAELTHKWTTLVANMADPEKPHILTPESFVAARDTWEELEGKTNSTVLWLPIYSQEKLSLGLWVEHWNVKEEEVISSEILDLLMNFLMPGYGSAWEKFKPKYALNQFGMKKRHIYLTLLGVFLMMIIIRVPLRIVAPCEVVPKEPYLITAPLEGIIEEVLVNPGDHIKSNAILFEYDKEVPLQHLKVTQKELQIIDAERDRAITIGLDDNSALTDLAILDLKRDKAALDLDLAEYNATLLVGKSPIEGIVMLDDPDDWRGKPVRVGEKIMTISDPQTTKVRIWIPEGDNVVLNPELPVKIFLNISPETSDEATLTYIANESTINDQNVPSFVAEATWIDPPKDVKLGLKGTAILYGERVTLAYYFFRKPWSTLRGIFGI